jgi:hypothetical protein
VVVNTRTAKDALVVPTTAVTLEASDSDKGTVMVVDDKSIAHETKVTVGIRRPDKIEIVDGLKEGETVVTEGNYALPDGAKTQIGDEGEAEKGEADKEKDSGAEGAQKKDGGEKGGAEKKEKSPKRGENP